MIQRYRVPWTSKYAKMQEGKKIPIPYRFCYISSPFGERLMLMACSLTYFMLSWQYTFIFMLKNYKARLFLRKSSESTATTTDFRFQYYWTTLENRDIKTISEMFNNKFSGFPLKGVCLGLSSMDCNWKSERRKKYKLFLHLSKGISRESFIALTRCHDCWVLVSSSYRLFEGICRRKKNEKNESCSWRNQWDDVEIINHCCHLEFLHSTMLMWRVERAMVDVQWNRFPPENDFNLSHQIT